MKSLIVLLVSFTILVTNIYAGEITKKPVEMVIDDWSVEWSKKQAEKRFDERSRDAQIDTVGIVCGFPHEKNCESLIFVLEIHYLNHEEDYAPALHCYDGTYFLDYVGSSEDNVSHLFEIPTFSWIHYMRNGFHGILVFTNNRAVTIDIPASTFKELDKHYESWKNE